MGAAMEKTDEALLRLSVTRWAAHGSVTCEDAVAVEVPVALEYNGISHAVMLASPQNLEEYALGFSLSEGILANPSELYECEVVPQCEGHTVRMRISAERLAGLKDRRRFLAGRTGCGLCGTESLAQAIRRPPPVPGNLAFSPVQIQAGMHAMKALQHLQHHTGATHAAAWMNADGAIALVREDVGRHNALDKLIGALAIRKIGVAGGVALITSRASYEMVQKCATAGIGCLAAISAPTSLAVQLAKDVNVSLLGFVREHGYVIYAGQVRVTHDSTPGES